VGRRRKGEGKLEEEECGFGEGLGKIAMLLIAVGRENTRLLVLIVVYS